MYDVFNSFRIKNKNVSMQAFTFTPCASFAKVPSDECCYCNSRYWADNIVPLCRGKHESSLFQLMVKHKKKIDTVRKFKKIVL